MKKNLNNKESRLGESNKQMNMKEYKDENGKELQKIIMGLEYKFDKQLSFFELSNLLKEREDSQIARGKNEILELVKNDIIKEAFIEQKTLYLSVEGKMENSSTTISSSESLKLDFGETIEPDQSEKFQLSNGFTVYPNNILTFTIDKKMMDIITKGGSYVCYYRGPNDNFNDLVDILRNKNITELDSNNFFEESNNLLIEKGVRITIKEED